MINFKHSIQTWALSSVNIPGSITISSQILKELKKQDIVIINYLYKTLSKYKGIVLNEDVGFNKYLQVSAFLGPTSTVIDNYTIIILCPDDAIIKWHYYISKYGHLQSYIIVANFQFEKINEYAAAFIIGFSNINLVKHFKTKDLFTVVIDDIDLVISKIIIKKLCGKFHIGLTSRNFYENPSQKLQWSILNWANPGCVGKFADFQDFDNDNFANLRDNYKEWWYRLTWNYCDTFKKPTKEQELNLEVTLNNWIEVQQLKISDEINVNSKKRKYKSKYINNFLDIKKESMIKPDIKCHNINQACNSNYDINVAEPNTSTSKTSILTNFELPSSLHINEQKNIKEKLLDFNDESNDKLIETLLSDIDNVIYSPIISRDKINEDGGSSNQNNHTEESSWGTGPSEVEKLLMDINKIVQKK